MILFLFLYMIDINTYIIEKLKINKSVSVKHLLKENDKILIVVLRIKNSNEKYIRIHNGIYKKIEETDGEINIFYTTPDTPEIFNQKAILNSNNFYEVEKNNRRHLFRTFKRYIIYNY